MAAIGALLLIIVAFPKFSFQIISRPVLHVLQPLFEAKVGLEAWLKNWKVLFKEKKSLYDENLSLREKLLELETKTAIIEILEKENAILKGLSASERREFLIASVISRPPYTPYDMLIIDVGSKDGVKEGMQVLAFGNVLLGYVTDVFFQISKVKLISSSGEETNVLLESSLNPAISVGRGGENFEIILPRAISVSIGERIITLGSRPLLVGIVERIEHQETDPYQKIIFRLPVNIQYLNRVFLSKK